jgi:hypothetical protein
MNLAVTRARHQLGGRGVTAIATIVCCGEVLVRTLLEGRRQQQLCHKLAMGFDTTGYGTCTDIDGDDVPVLEPGEDQSLRQHRH